MIASTTAFAAIGAIAMKATVILIITVLIERTLLRRASAAARHQLWTTTLVALMALPAVAVVLPGWGVTMPKRLTDATGREQIRASAAAPETQPFSRERSDAVSAGSIQVSRETPEPLGTPATPALAAARHVPWTLLLILAYVGGVLLLLAKLASEHVLVRRLARVSMADDDPARVALLASLSARFGIRRRVVLLQTRQPITPLTWGITRPHVMIPAASSDWPAERQRAALLHELAHVARHDCLTQTLAAIACAVYWPHPGIWWAAARLRAERELACDDRAITSGIPACDYADHLLEIARSFRRPRQYSALAVGMAATSHLETRLLAAIDTTRRRSAPGRRAMLAGGAIAAIVLVPLAAVRARTATAATPSHLTQLEGAVVVAPNVPQQAFGGRWNIRLADSTEAAFKTTVPVIHVSMLTPGLNTFYIPLSQVDGLSATQITGTEPSARFRLRRDPGTFTFEGSFQQARGSGRFTFAPDTTFAAELVRRGMQPPTAEQQFSLARHGMGIDFLDELAAQGYARPTTAAFVRSSFVGPDVDELRTLAALGYKLGTLEMAMRLHSSGVTPEEIRAFADLGYTGLTIEQLIRAHNQSVSPEVVRETNAKAGRRLSFAELIAARRRDETPSATEPPPREAAGESSTPLAGDWAITNVAGPRLQIDIEWDGHNQWKRFIGETDLADLPLTVVGAASTTDSRFRFDQDAGVFHFEGTFLAGRGRGRFRFEPNRSFAATLRSLGVQNTDEITDHDLKNMAFFGISAAVVREITALGVTPLTRRDVVDMAIREVTPDFVRAMRAAEVTDAATAEGIVELKFRSVSPLYVTELATLGYKRLSGEQINDLARAAVSPEFIRRMQAEGHRNATPEMLIELRRQR